MRILLKLTIAALAVSLTACESVTSPVPLGHNPVSIQEGEWAGRWFNSEGHLDLSVVDAAKGLVQVGYQEDGIQRTLDLQLREAAGWIFVNVTESDFNESQGLGDLQSKGFLWARIVKDGDMIIAWNPDPDAFVTLVKEGKLPGTVEDGSVVLEPLSAEHYGVITSGANGVVLEWESPVVLYRFESGKSPE
jgi:hypothetical protein